MIPTVHVDVLQANIGLPLLFVGWFEMAIALIPVVVIETTIISIRSGIPWTDVIWSVGWANAVSTAVGVPLTFILMHVIQIATGARSGYNPGNKMFLPPWRAVEIIFENTPKRLVSSSLFSLLIPSYFVSCLIELPLIAHWLSPAPRLNSGVWLANLASYGVLALYAAWHVVRSTEAPNRYSDFNATPKGWTSSSIAISPDGTLIGAGWGDQVRLLDFQSGKLLRRFRGHENLVRLVAISPDKRYLVANAWDTTFFLWECASGKRIGTLGGGYYLSGLAFSPSGQFFASSSQEDNVALLAGEPFENVSHLEGSREMRAQGMCVIGENALCVAFSPNSSILAASYETDGSNPTRIHLWSLENFNLLRKLSEEEADETDIGNGRYSPDYLVFSPIGPLLAARGGRMQPGLIRGNAVISIWDYEQGLRLSEDEMTSFWPASMSFNDDGKQLIFGCSDGSIRFWNIESRQIRNVIPAQIKHTSASVHFLRDGKWVIFSITENGELLMERTHDGGPPTGVVVLGKSGWVPYVEKA